MLKSLLAVFFEFFIFTLFSQNIPNGNFEITNANWEGIYLSYKTTMTVTNNGWDSKLGPVNGAQFLEVTNTTMAEGEIHNKFKCAFRPVTFSFHLGYFRLYSSEAMGFEVLLSKWNSIKKSRDTICFLNEAIHSPDEQIIPWTVVNRSLQNSYCNSDLPDSASISFYNDVTKPVSSSTFMVIDECKWGYQPPSGKTFVGIDIPAPLITNVFYYNSTLYFKFSNICSNQNVIISIFNINGQEIMSQKVNLTSNHDFEIIETTALINGIYIINISTGNTSENRKLLIKN